jgi:hypothetical protein
MVTGREGKPKPPVTLQLSIQQKWRSGETPLENETVIAAKTAARRQILNAITLSPSEYLQSLLFSEQTEWCYVGNVIQKQIAGVQKDAENYCSKVPT